MRCHAFELLDAEDEGTTNLRNAGSYLNIVTALHPK